MPDPTAEEKLAEAIRNVTNITYPLDRLTKSIEDLTRAIRDDIASRSPDRI